MDADNNSCYNASGFTSSSVHDVVNSGGAGVKENWV